MNFSKEIYLLIGTYQQRAIKPKLGNPKRLDQLPIIRGVKVLSVLICTNILSKPLVTPNTRHSKSASKRLVPVPIRNFVMPTIPLNIVVWAANYIFLNRNETVHYFES